VAHDLQRAAAWAERMVLLTGGRVVADGPPDRVLEERASQAFGVVVRGHAVAGLPAEAVQASRKPSLVQAGRRERPNLSIR